MSERNKNIPVDLILGSHGSKDVPKLQVFVHTLNQAMVETDKKVLAVIESSGTPSFMSNEIFERTKRGELPSQVFTEVYSDALEQLAVHGIQLGESSFDAGSPENAFRSETNKILDNISRAYPMRLLILHEHVDGGMMKAGAETLANEKAGNSAKMSALNILQGDFRAGTTDLRTAVVLEAEIIKARENRVVKQIENICLTNDVGVVVARFGTAHIGLAVDMKAINFPVYTIKDDVVEDATLFAPYIALARKARFNGIESISSEEWRQGLVANAMYSLLSINLTEGVWTEEDLDKANIEISKASRVFRNKKVFNQFKKDSAEMGFARTIKAMFSS